jgi:predicted transcriptional regulator
MRAREIISSPVVAVRAESSVKHAAKLLASYGFTALPGLDIGDRFDNATDRQVTTVRVKAVPGVTAVNVLSESAND